MRGNSRGSQEALVAITIPSALPNSRIPEIYGCNNAEFICATACRPSVRSMSCAKGKRDHGNSIWKARQLSESIDQMRFATATARIMS